MPLAVRSDGKVLTWEQIAGSISQRREVTKCSCCWYALVRRLLIRFLLALVTLRMRLGNVDSKHML
jgi:hypothetical protein